MIIKALKKLKRFYNYYGSIIIVEALLYKYKNFFSNFNSKQGITLIITSSGRKSYLERTIDSLKKNLPSEFKIYWYIIDDYPKSKETQDYIKTKGFDKFFFNKKNKGLGYSLNRINSKIKTKYVFHCEDDWEFLKIIPLQRMIKILESNNSIGQVILNRVQPYKTEAIVVKEDYGVYDKTFSFNPHLTTFKIVNKCIPYTLKETERKTTDKMRVNNIKSVILGYKNESFVNHIGDEKIAIKY